MNKRIRKKRERYETTKKNYTMTVLVDAIAACRHCAESDVEPKGYIRWRTYLKKYKLHKRDTYLGSKII